MEKRDHVSLTLSAATGTSDELSTISGNTASRKSFRRTWNQLPRLQRNLIILGISAACITFFLFVSNDQWLTDNNQRLSSGGAFPVGQLNERDIKLLELQSRTKFKLIGQNREDEAGGNDIADQSQSKENQQQEIQEPVYEGPINDPRLLDTPLNNVNEKINIEQLELSNNIETPISENVRFDLGTLIVDPKLVPGSKVIIIKDYVAHLVPKGDAEKQHFHGAHNERQVAVVNAFQHSWKAYKKYAWGSDTLKPYTCGSHDWFGLGLTIIDSLDTIYIMGLDDEFQEARDWVSGELSFDINRDVNLFEVTIRVLGGLLATYHLSGDKMFLERSMELGNRLLPCFNSPSGIPYSDVNLASLNAHSPKWSPDSSTSEVTTLQLEFRDLTRSTDIPIYEKVVNVVNEKVHELEKVNGLVPIFINANTGTFRSYSTISLGARGDSYYEYLLKQWLQTGRKENDPLILDYMRAMDGVLTQLMRRTPREKHVYIGELINGKEFKPKMDHLTCYLPGTLLLGHKYGMPDSHLTLAHDLLETCFQTYMKQPTHLAPEISYFAVSSTEGRDIYVKPSDTHNLLRPEFIESLYYFYALTGNQTYQDMGWQIFQAFEKYTKLRHGYSSINNVKNVFDPKPRDSMESFWLGETLKYFYLLFSDNRNEIDLEHWIFNTEAHPLPVREN